MEVFIMANNYEKIIKAEWKKFHKDKEFRPTIMLLGATGCGKSSLINLVFGKNLAEVNDVSRGTDDFKTYKGKEYNIGVNLIDSRGYEMEDGDGESFSNYFKSIKDKIKRNAENNPLEKIHIIWFCISVAGDKIQDYDIKILKLLQSESELRNRVSVVLTKCDEDDEDGSGANIFRQIIYSDVGNNTPVFEVSTDLNLKLDLENLMFWSIKQLNDKDMKEAFVAAQKISLKAKKKAAEKRIAIYATTSFGVGFTPLPMSDAALLVPLQITMSTHIIRIYGMENLVNISSAVIGNIVVSNLGKSLAGGIIKLIPGIGTLIGGLINAGVASLITSALGFAISTICYESCKKIAKGEYVDISNMFDIDTIQMYTQKYIKTHKK